VNTIKQSLRPALVALGLLVLALPPVTARADSAAEIDIKTDAALKQFVASVDGAQVFLDNAKGVLVFPSVFRLGFFFGGGYGEGALRIDGRTVDYYNVVAGSWGLQIGAQTQTVIIVFIEQAALDQFRASKGWEVGVDGSVALVEFGGAASVTTMNAKDPIVGFIFNNKGLMVALTLEGSKITKLNKTGKAGTAAPAPAPPPTDPTAPAAPVQSATPGTDEEDDGIILRRP
jgi:lipid-binding SYLF domain-containing protein